MNSLPDVNLRDLTTWYLEADRRARTASDAIEKYYADSAYVRSLIDHEREESISESDDIQLHGSVYRLLQFYSLVELACLIRFVPTPLPEWFADRALRHLSQPDIVAYYEEEIPLLLPQQLRLRLLGTHNLADENVEHVASNFTQIICLNRMIENDADVDVLRRLIGPRGYNTCSEEDLFVAIRDPQKFFEYLQVEPRDQGLLERGMHGVRKFIAFCREFDSFLCSIDYAPLLCSGAWHYHNYWFGYRSTSIARMFRSIQESLGKLVESGDREGFVASEEAIADISAMSKRLLEGSHQAVLRDAARNAFRVDRESHRGIDPERRRLHNFGWYHELVGRMDEKLGDVAVFKGPLGVAALLALPLIVSSLLLSIVGALHPILAFLLTIAVLLYCLGPENLEAQVDSILTAIRTGNDAEANRLAQALGHLTEPVSVETRGRTVVESILTEFPERVFGVVLWFLILGPIGAVLFRFSAELRRYATQSSSGLRDWAGRVYNVLAWLPSRIVALGYALSGSVTGAFESWRVLATLTPNESNEAVLRNSGTGALQLASDTGEVEQITAAQGLVTRTLVVLLGILVVLYVMGWIR